MLPGPLSQSETARRIWRTRAVPGALLMLASNFPNRLFRAANAPSRMAPSRIVLVVPLAPPLIFIAETSPLASERAGSESFCSTSFQLARSLGFARGRVPGEGGRERSGIKMSIVAVNVASLPGNLLVMLISSYKPFIIVDEQLIRLPGPLAWQC